VLERRPRWGFRKCFGWRRHDGRGWNEKRFYRVYCSMRLNLKRTARRRLLTRECQPLLASTEFNRVWALDFMCYMLYDGRPFRTLNAIDEGNRGTAHRVRHVDPVIARGSHHGPARVLSRLLSVHGAPLFLRSDNGPGFVCQAILEWIAGTGIATVLNDPGKPWQNAADESFNGKFRDECLSVEWLRSRREAKVIIETWRQHYNEVRPHSSLQHLTPREFRRQLRQDLQPAVF
jgi:putative transposase